MVQVGYQGGCNFTERVRGAFGYVLPEASYPVHEEFIVLAPDQCGLAQFPV